MELGRGLRDGTPFLLLIFDLDDFKDINDTYGHAAGDETLRRVAAAVRDTVRAVDTFARIGGDEFILLAPGAGPRDGPEMALRLEEVISGLRLEFNGQVCIPRASVGWAAWQPGVRESEDLLRAADEAMYRQKATKHLRRR
jgi:diguanylate cyclase (GGDEF)-like protein